MNKSINELLAQAATELEKQSAEYEEQQKTVNAKVLEAKKQKEFISKPYDEFDELGMEIAEYQEIEKEMSEELEYAKMEEYENDYHVDIRWL